MLAHTLAAMATTPVSIVFCCNCCFKYVSMNQHCNLRLQTFTVTLPRGRNAESHGDRHEGEGATCLSLHHQMGDGSTSLFQKLTSEC